MVSVTADGTLTARADGTAVIRVFAQGLQAATAATVDHQIRPESAAEAAHCAALCARLDQVTNPLGLAVWPLPYIDTS